MPKSGPKARRTSWRKYLNNLKSKDGSPEIEVNVGERLQALRQMRGLSQRALAEMSGLNFNTLSLIENQKTSPNVSTLQQLANALEVPITAFFEGRDVQRPNLVFQRSSERQGIAFDHGSFSDMSGGMSLASGTPLLLSLDPHQHSGEAPLVHSGEEFIYILAGVMVYWVNGEEYRLEAGDSLIFESNLPHRWSNPTDILAQAVVVICPNDEEDPMVAQHLPLDEE